MEKLEIRYNLVKEDGSFGMNEYINADNIDVWFIRYQGFNAIIDSSNRIIELGASATVDVEELNMNWFELQNFDIELELYPEILKKIVAFVGDVDRRMNGGKLSEDPTWKTLDLLIGNSLIIGDPMGVGRAMGINSRHLDYVKKSLAGDKCSILADIHYHLAFLDEEELSRLLDFEEKLVKGII